MKMNNIYEIDKNGRIGDLLMDATDEQLEIFKKEREGAKIFYAEHKKYINKPTDFDYCVISYEPKIIFTVVKKDEDRWTEIAIYNTKGAANKRIDNELKLCFSDFEKRNDLRNRLKVVSRYQTINEVI